jgi:general L-amino acid transport system substrate-binding protein
MPAHNSFFVNLKGGSKMINSIFKTRLSSFAIGIVLGWATLSACGAITTATPTEALTEQATVAAQTTEASTQAAAQPPQQAATTESTLDTVVARGTLKCGVNPGLPGFSSVDSSGKNAGFDVDFCRAVATAVFGDPNKVEFTPLTADQRLPALQAGEIDVLIRNTTWTLTRDSTNGLDFTVTNFYDGQGYLVNKKFTKVDDLNGAKICVLSGTTSEQNLSDDFAKRNLTYDPVVLAKSEETFASLSDGSCDALTSDKSQLAAGLSAMPNKDNFVILPDTISKEPLGPVVRQNDSRWRDVVVWTLYAMIQADELGINQGNVDSFKSSTDVTVQRLLGTHEKEDLGSGLGLSKDWAYKVIKMVGAYSDVYDRNLTPIGIGRDGTLNAIWSQGGLMYSPAYR